MAIGDRDGHEKHIQRRRFLGLAAAAGSVLVVPRWVHRAWARPARWSDPRTWGGRVPGRRNVALVDRTVLLDVDAHVRGVVIRPGGKLVFQPGKSRTLRSRGNVVVEGRLVMRPNRASAVHRIVFAGVDESDFRGGGHEVLASDVGLWVMHHGMLDIAGHSKTPWARAAGGITAGATTVELNADPVGWRAGDEIVITPTVAPTDPSHFETFDRRRVAAVTGRTVTLDAATTFDHPAVSVDQGRTQTPEVLNLTRNARIEGTRKGRAHVFIHSRHPQTVRFAALRHLGPRESRGRGSVEVLGRYGLHFHHSYNGSRGSRVEGVVVRDCGNHSFVPHTSHGIRFLECIAYDVQEAPFWWDEGDVTNDTVWDRCVAAKVGSDNPGRRRHLSGFLVGRGRGNTVRGSVATGVGGEPTASGFRWAPEPVNGVWTFEDCTAHNNKINGIFVWQKNPDVNVVTRFVGYHNGDAGIQHGSLRNRFRYVDAVLFGNAVSQLRLHANSGAAEGEGLTFVNALFDGAGISEHDVVTNAHLAEALGPVELLECRFLGFTQTPVAMKETFGTFPGRQDFVRCEVGSEARDLEAADFQIFTMTADGYVRVQSQDDLSAYQMNHQGQVTSIQPFAPPRDSPQE